MTSNIAVGQDVSLLHGWLPTAIQVLTVAVLVLAIGKRPARWSVRWLPAAVLTGAVAAVATHWYVQHQGLSGKAAPIWLWGWILLTVVAVVVLFAGWCNSDVAQRISSIIALPLCVLCVVMTINIWVGYLPTVSSAWQLGTQAGGTGEVDMDTLRSMRDRDARPSTGTLVVVDVPADASGFKHRPEVVYLPPVWFSTKPEPALPAIMMIGGEFGSPYDWLSNGAKDALDDYADSHGGRAPVVFFVDHSGAFLNDTECVNGKRGNAADHLMKDVIPFAVSIFGVSQEPGSWGIVGWSAGGTCALTLAVSHPEVFSAFVDIDGQASPNAGNKDQTIQRLFGGDTRAWASFDPATIMAAHGTYRGLSGWFDVSEPVAAIHRPGIGGTPGVTDVPVPDPADLGNDAGVAQYMCALASSYGIDCAVVAGSGEHNFAASAKVFPAALPWLAAKIGTPGAAAVALPGE